MEFLYNYNKVTSNKENETIKKDLLKSIKYNLKRLKHFDKLETKEKIEIVKYDVPVEFYNFQEEKLINFYNHYAIMMGILDSFIDRRKYDIEKERKSLYRYERELEYVYGAREEIANNLMEIEIKLSDKDKDATKGIRKSILEYPAHKNFDNIYNEARVKYSNTHIEFINEYYKGYYYSENLRFRDIVYINRRYQELFELLYEQYRKNNEKIEKAKIKEYSKSYPNYL